jgi:hypothetical protein
MPEINTGMTKQAMKDLLLKSKKDPVNCAFGDGVTSGYAQLLLDKIRQGRVLDQELATKFPKVKNTRFGTASVDVDIDPKLVTFIVNKAVSGMAKKLVKTVKPAGFTRVVIMTDDGKQVDADRDDEAQEMEPGLAMAENAPDSGDSAEAVPDAPPPPPADPAELKRDLARLIGMIGTVSDPVRRASLAALASGANEQFKVGALDAMAGSIDRLRAAMDTRPATPPAAAAKGGAMVVYAKSRLAWLGARQRVESDIERLRVELLAAFNGHPDVPDLDDAYRRFVGPVLSTLDERLADTLDLAMNAADTAVRQKHVAEAKEIIAGYEAYLESTSVIEALDDNPVVPLAIRQTLGGALATLSRSIH